MPRVHQLCNYYNPVLLDESCIQVYKHIIIADLFHHKGELQTADENKQTHHSSLTARRWVHDVQTFCLAAIPLLNVWC